MSFRFLTAGESHGKGLVGILEGLPADIEILSAAIEFHMKRRKLGHGRGFRQKIEDDAVEIVAGIRHGKTLGSPISLIIWNKDAKNWGDIMQVAPLSGEVKREVHVPRPGHADYLGGVKYQHQDMRNVLERASARETAMRVALGSLARKFLEDLGIDIASRIVEIGGAKDSSPLNVAVKDLNAITDASLVRCLSEKVSAEMVSEIDTVIKQKDTLGGIFEVYASGLPLGLGSYVHWDRRLEAEIGRGFLSLNAVKGVEVGAGFELGRIPGSKAHDEYLPGAGSEPGKLKFKTNRAGGITGGMTTGQTLIIRTVMKPISTLMQPLDSVDLKTGKAVKAHVERSDACAAPAAAVICESILALILAAALLEKFGGDTLEEIQSRVKDWRKKTQ